MHGSEEIELTARCAECEAIWPPGDAQRWRAYPTDDEPPELAFFCPKCAEREFGE